MVSNSKSTYIPKSQKHKAKEMSTTSIIIETENHRDPFFLPEFKLPIPSYTFYYPFLVL